MTDSNDSIQILQNQIFIETIIKFSNYSHLTCVNQFDAQNDIFELKNQGSGGVSIFLIFFIIILILNFYYKATISLKIINKGIPTKLKFGKNRDLEFITISSTNTSCDENFEIALTVLIRNGQIVESECERKERLLVLSNNKSTNVPKMILFPGEHFISFKNLKFNFNFAIIGLIKVVHFNCLTLGESREVDQTMSYTV